MFLNIHMLFIILNTYDQQFTLTTKKSLHTIFKGASARAERVSVCPAAHDSAEIRATETSGDRHCTPCRVPEAA